ncbi:hypothetical protein CL614_02220 [archaeon]|nr:hypothetical protein [archaeon]
MRLKQLLKPNSTKISLFIILSVFWYIFIIYSVTNQCAIIDIMCPIDDTPCIEPINLIPECDVCGCSSQHPIHTEILIIFSPGIILYIGYSLFEKYR